MNEQERRDTKRARELRNAATPAERLLWSHLSNRQVAGAKFSRQMPVGPYFADFLCREHKLIVEIDGFSHDLRTEHDARRGAFLRQAGYRFLRFSNEDVRKNLEGVIASIEMALAHLRPLPRAGGEPVALNLPSHLPEGSGVGL